MVVAALGVVTTKNVVHGALWLVVVLAGVAAQYILAAAEFVAVCQVLVYIGAVMVLFLFGIMLTRAQIGRERTSTTATGGSPIPVALILLGLLVVGDHRRLRGPEAARAGRTDLDRGHRRPSAVALPVPFLAISFILLAAAIGAIVLARKD